MESMDGIYENGNQRLQDQLCFLCHTPFGETYAVSEVKPGMWTVVCIGCKILDRKYEDATT